MKNVKAYAVIGSGYGDEGKGLMTDYFCGRADGKVLNIKVNGGAQAGHTVCRITDDLSYNSNVFHSMGSGTFAGADTYLGQKFMIDSKNLLEEFERYSVWEPVLYINPDCRIVLSIDIFMNRILETIRNTEKHGTCGFGVFEAVNRNHAGFGLRIKDALQYLNDNILEEYIFEISKNYVKFRIKEIAMKEGISLDNNPCLSNVFDELQDYATIDTKYFRNLIRNDKIKLMNLDEIIDEGYSSVVFECSQGLELDWSDKRNFPHVTASHTGLRNVVKEINSLKKNKVLSLEVCYVTRSYKTKHGDGNFFEEDNLVKDDYRLYDRTNIPNDYQGVLKYGRLDLDRLSTIIQYDFDTYIKDILSDCYITKSLSITHLDQTRESVLTTEGDVYFKTIKAENIINGDKTYYSFGEKATDIFFVC